MEIFYFLKLEIFQKIVIFKKKIIYKNFKYKCLQEKKIKFLQIQKDIL